MKIKQKKGVLLFILIFLLLFTLVTPVRAVLEVTFDSSLPINRIQYYWNGDANSANNDGRTINPDPMISFDLSNADRQAKPKATPPTDVYVFGADPAYPNSGTIKIRVWSGIRQSDGARYSALWSKANPAGELKSETFSISYENIKDTPSRGQIYQVDETSSLTLPATRTGRMTIFSRQTPRTDGLTVERKACQWEVVYNGTPLDMTGRTEANLDLSTPTYTFNSGDIYRARVRYQNMWDVWGDWSEWYEHPISGTGGAMTVTCNFNTTSALGVNQFSIPARLPVTFDGPTVTGRSINTIQNLIDAIVAERVGVNTLGWWDPVRQVMVGWSELAGTPREQNSPGSRSDALVQDRAYQVSVSAPITFTLTGTR